MVQQQERARKTRASIIKSAAQEFSRSGYVGASLNRILDGSGATKGAMYFHFDSKDALANAVMESALDGHKAATKRWQSGRQLDAFESLYCLFSDLAQRIAGDPVIRAEFRLGIEPELRDRYRELGAQWWSNAVTEIADRAQRTGLLRDHIDAPQFARLVGAILVGQQYLLEMGPDLGDLEERFVESLEIVLEAVAAPEWLAEWKANGWSNDLSGRSSLHESIAG